MQTNPDDFASMHVFAQILYQGLYLLDLVLLNGSVNLMN